MRTAVPAGSYILTSPFNFIFWWFLESPKIVFKILYFFLATTIHLFGYKSLFKTFFKPWKNEYREGLVGFSLIMGMATKSSLIFIETILILFLVVIEVIVFATWLLLPFIVLWGIYAGLFA